MLTHVLAPPDTFMSTVNANDSNVVAARRALIVTLTDYYAGTTAIPSGTIVQTEHVMRMNVKRGLFFNA